VQWLAWLPSLLLAGIVGPVGAIAIGLIAGFACLWGVNGLKTPAGC